MGNRLTRESITSPSSGISIEEKDGKIVVTHHNENANQVFEFDLTLSEIFIDGTASTKKTISVGQYCSYVQCHQCTTVDCTTIQCTTVNCTTVNCTTIQCNTVQCSGRCTGNCLECNNCKHQSGKCDASNTLCVNCYNCYDCQNYT